MINEAIKEEEHEHNSGRENRDSIFNLWEQYDIDDEGILDKIEAFNLVGEYLV